jgi:UDP-hydrolysing UDP-N-acetyl-D-glucosamine 2-epimerase
MVLVFIGSRANYGRLKAVIDQLISNSIDFGIVLGSYDISKEYQQYVVFRVDNLLYKDTTYNMVSSMGLVALNVTSFLSNLNRLPKLAIVHGDRFENLGFAIACSYNNIKLLHTEGGEFSGNIDNKIRMAITALADIHCVTTQNAAEHLIKAGIDESKVFNTGSPAIDEVKNLNLPVLKYPSDIIAVLYNPCEEDDFDEFFKAILKLSAKYKIVWINPNIDPGYKMICKQVHANKQIEFMKGLSVVAYFKVLNMCKMLIGNTSSGIKECAYLGIPYIMVGIRQNNREIDENVLVRTGRLDEILYRVNFAERYIEKYGGRIKYNGLFGWGDAAEKIVKVVRGVLDDSIDSI